MPGPVCRTNPASRSSCINVSLDLSAPPHSAPFPCRAPAAQEAVPGTAGAWSLSPKYTYMVDLGLVSALGVFFRSSSVIELGAGKGCYTALLRSAGLDARGFDGAPQVARLTDGLVQTADLTEPLVAPPADFVLCLEVAEHIPPALQHAFLDNLHNSNRRGIVLSWSTFAGMGSNGHVNPRANAWVVRTFTKLGYEHDADAQRRLRSSVSKLHWFRDSLLVFRKPKALSSAHLAGARRRGPTVWWRRGQRFGGGVAKGAGAPPSPTEPRACLSGAGTDRQAARRTAGSAHEGSGYVASKGAVLGFE